ncbi:MAG: hypothetical protein OEM62_04660 [Acidobacteriota bacterium]|nr:hypothetical protein [Acidobacteriota bacterium]
MQRKSVLIALIIGLSATIAFADLEPWKDYEVSDAVWAVTTVKVDPNMGDAYLEGIAQTWAASNEVAKGLGQIEEYAIYRSDLPQSGDFNLLLVVKFAKTEDLAPNKARYEAFMAKWGEERQKASTEKAQRDYPGMRNITGQYNFRKIELKK